MQFTTFREITETIIENKTSLNIRSDAKIYQMPLRINARAFFELYQI